MKLKLLKKVFKYKKRKQFSSQIIINFIALTLKIITSKLQKETFSDVSKSSNKMPICFLAKKRASTTRLFFFWDNYANEILLT